MTQGLITRPEPQDGGKFLTNMMNQMIWSKPGHRILVQAPGFSLRSRFPTSPLFHSSSSSSPSSSSSSTSSIALLRLLPALVSFLSSTTSSSSSFSSPSSSSPPPPPPLPPPPSPSSRALQRLQCLLNPPRKWDLKQQKGQA